MCFWDGTLVLNYFILLPDVLFAVSHLGFTQARGSSVGWEVGTSAQWTWEVEQAFMLSGKTVESGFVILKLRVYLVD